MRKSLFKVVSIGSIGVLWSLAMASATAQEAPEAKPFAEHKVVLQISDEDPSKQTLVLNVANNLVKKYGIDNVDIEIVAFGPGLRLLFDGNANMSRIDGLRQSGVRFAACQNTIDNMSRLLGHPVEINPQAFVVPGGVARIMELNADGYILVRP